jgi:hypothetical protein
VDRRDRQGTTGAAAIELAPVLQLHVGVEAEEIGVQIAS